MQSQEASEQNSPETQGDKRPTAITVICVIGIIGSLFTIPLFFTDIAAQVGDWYPPYLGFSTLIGFICMIGLWKMKKWAAYTYTGFVALNQIVLILTGTWSLMALLIPTIVVGIALSHLNKMD